LKETIPTGFQRFFKFVGKNIRKGKDTVKEKDRAKGRGTEGVIFSIQA